jgi:hypothetical protein
MSINGFVPPEVTESITSEALEELKRLMSLKDNVSPSEITETWLSLQQMQKDLEIPSLFPIRQHYYFYQKLQEIKIALDLPFTDFIQLNQLYIEISTLRKILGVYDTTPVSEIIPLIQKHYGDKKSSLNIGSDSLLYKILLFHKVTAIPNTSTSQERPPIVHNLDRVLFEILVSYGPLSRPELVELTGVPRSSIYDSLRRLIFKKFVIKYPERRSPRGRPTTMFDVLI